MKKSALAALVFVCTLILAGCSGCAKNISDKLGLSKECEPSSEIPERREFPVNEALSPCDDFYEYACSKPLACFKLRDDRSRHMLAINDSVERILNHQKEYLKNIGSKKDLSPRAQILRDNYLACMNEGARTDEEKALVKSTVAEVEAIPDRAALVGFLGKEVTKPRYSFISFDQVSNQDDSEWYDLYLDATIMSLPEKSYYEKPELMKDFRAVVEDFFNTIGMKNAAERADNVVNFETAFAKTYPKPEEVRELINKRLFIDRATWAKKYPNLEMASLFGQIPAKTKVRHIYADSFAFANKALATFPVDQLKDVYLYHALSGYLDDAYPEHYKKAFEFRNKHLGGPPKRSEREERCTKLAISSFGKEFDSELIDELFPNFPVEKFEAIVERIRAGMIQRLEKNTWLSEKGKAGALRKMKAASMQLVKPKNDAEWDFLPLAKYNEKAPIANSRLRQEKYIAKVLSEFTKPRNKHVWAMGPLTVNAYYSPDDNKFVMLQGILQYPFFEPNAVDAVNFGAAGMVVGHELGHAIDDQGAKYDENGELNQWMTDEDLAEFKKLGTILVEQYAKADPSHNGQLTLGENIADTTGLSFSYSAAFPEDKGSIEDKKAFFLQYARLWCGKMLPSELEKRLKTDPHAQTNVRVNEPMKHQPGFYEAYGCKAGDGMYLPEEKRLKLW